MNLNRAAIRINDTSGLVPPGELWLGVDELVREYRGEHSESAARRSFQRLLTRWEHDGTCEVKRLAGRVGRPRLQVLASDFERWAGLDGALAA